MDIKCHGLAQNLFKNIICLLKILTSLHKMLAVGKLLADGEFLQVAVNGGEILKLREKNSNTVNIQNRRATI
jgi:hypothetical protein